MAGTSYLEPLRKMAAPRVVRRAIDDVRAAVQAERVTIAALYATRAAEKAATEAMYEATRWETELLQAGGTHRALREAAAQREATRLACQQATRVNTRAADAEIAAMVKVGDARRALWKALGVPDGMMER